MTTPSSTTPPRSSPQADGSSESLHKAEHPPASKANTSHPQGERSDEHMGATEQQVSKTTPPSPDDDEPKQG
jgi:hypothetical protein